MLDDLLGSFALDDKARSDVADVLEYAADNLFTNGFRKHMAGQPGEEQCVAGHICTSAWLVVGITPEVLRWEAGGSMPFLSGSVVVGADARRRQRWLETMARRMLVAHLGLNQLKNGDLLPDWNDNKETTAEDVREALLLTAKDLRNAH